MFAPEVFLPGSDLGPRAFVDGVVNGYDGAHVGCGRVVRFAPHRVEEHAFGGVDPVPAVFIGACVALGICGVGGG